MSDCNHKGMNGIIQELKGLLKAKNIGTDSDRALLLDFQATLETKPEKAIKLEKDALAQIENITADNARLVSNLHANLGGLYRMTGDPDLAREHMEKSISLLDQFNLLHINDSIPQIANYAMFKEASRTYIFNADTFKLDTDPKVVSFEMEASGFNCN